MPTIEEVQKLKREVESLKEKSAQMRGEICSLRKQIQLAPEMTIKECLTQLELERDDLEAEWDRQHEQYERAVAERQSEDDE